MKKFGDFCDGQARGFERGAQPGPMLNLLCSRARYELAKTASLLKKLGADADGIGGHRCAQRGVADCINLPLLHCKECPTSPAIVRHAVPAGAAAGLAE